MKTVVITSSIFVAAAISLTNVTAGVRSDSVRTSAIEAVAGNLATANLQLSFVKPIYGRHPEVAARLVRSIAGCLNKEIGAETRIGIYE